MVSLQHVLVDAQAEFTAEKPSHCRYTHMVSLQNELSNVKERAPSEASPTWMIFKWFLSSMSSLMFSKVTAPNVRIIRLHLYGFSPV